MELLTMANQISVNTGSGAGAQQVIVDSNGNITVTVSRSVIGTVANVASANYANFAGNVVNAAQPNITSVGTLSNLTVANTITTNNLVVTGNLSVGNLVANNANYANFAGNAFAVAGANVSGTVANATFATTAGSANTANSATVANSANAVAGANVSGTVANATYADNAGNANFANSATVANSANSVTLANVSGAGNIASINLDGSSSNVLRGDGTFAPEGSTGNANYANFAGNAFSVDGSNVVGAVANATFALDAGNANIANIAYSVSGANVSGAVANATFALDAGNANIANIAYSVAAANVSGLGNIATINLDGNASNVLFGNGSFGPEGSTGNANYANFAGNAFSVDGANVVGAVANATFALDAGNANIANIAYSVDGANVSGTVANATFALDAGNANIANIAYSVDGANVSGTVANATFALDAGNANIANIAYSVDAANVSGLGNIATINLDGNVSNLLTGNGTFVAIPTDVANANYANFAGTVLTNAQPNITSVGTLTALAANTSTPISIVSTNGNVTFNTINSANTAGRRLEFAYQNPTSNLTVVFGADEAGFGYYMANTAAGNIGTGNIRSYWQFLTNGDLRHTVGGSGNVIAKNIILGNVFTGQYNGNIVAGNGNLNVGNITLANVGRYVGNGSGITALTGANVTGFVPNANVANTAYSVAAANVSGLGNIATINLDASSSNVLYGNGTFAPVAGGGSVAGSNTEIQFNSNGAFGASSALTFDGANLQVTGNISVNANTSNQPITVNNEGNGGISSYNMYNDTSVFAVQNFYRTRGNNAVRTAVGTNDTVFTQNYGAYGDSGNTYVSLGYQENKVGTNSGNAISLVTNFAASHPGSSFSISGYDTISLNGNVTANYFSGDGSNITNVNSIQNGNSSVQFTGVDGDLLISTNNITNGVQVSGRQIQLTGLNTGPSNISSINLINGALNWTLDNTNFGGGTPFGMNRYISGFMDPMNYFTARGDPGTPADVQVGDAAFNERVQVRYDGTTHNIFNADVNVLSFSPSNTVAATYVIGAQDDQANSVFQVNFGTANVAGTVTTAGNVNVASGNVVLDTTGNITATGRLDYLRTFGSFTSNATQTSNGANTTNYMTLNNTEDANGISIASSTQITVARPGRYNIQFSAQLEKTDSGSDIIEIWLDKNGTAVANSATQIQLAGNNAKSVAAWDFNVNAANVNDYFRLAWASPDTDVQITAVPGANTISGVAIPSVIVDINPIGA
jgi:hypothetical protein